MSWSPRKKMVYGLYAIIALSASVLLWRVVDKERSAPVTSSPVTQINATTPQPEVISKVSIGEKLLPNVQKIFDQLARGESVMIVPQAKDLTQMTKAELQQIKKLVAVWPSEYPQTRNNLIMIYARNIREPSDVGYFKELVMQPVSDASKLDLRDPKSMSTGMYVLRTIQIMLRLAPVKPETKKALHETVRAATKSPNPEVAKVATQIMKINVQ